MARVPSKPAAGASALFKKGSLSPWLDSVKTATGVDPRESNARMTCLLLDTSVSMDGAPLAEAIAGAKRFNAECLAAGQAVGLICFGSSASVLAEPSRSGIAKQLEAIGCNGSTNMAAGVELAAGSLLGLQRKGIPANVGPVGSPASGFVNLHGQCTMVIATDGYPDDAEAALAAAERAKRAGITILVIGTTECDAAFLGRLASSAKLAIVTPAGTLGMAIAHSTQLLVK